MRTFVVSAAFAALLAFPALAGAQAGGICQFDGAADISPAIGSTPMPCPSASGCTGYRFTGTTGRPACGGVAGTVSEPAGKFCGAYACAGNSHGGTASTSIGPISYRGVCAGPDCSGVGYKTLGGFQYNMVFTVDTVQDALAQCPNDAFTHAEFSGTAEGGGN